MPEQKKTSEMVDQMRATLALMAEIKKAQHHIRNLL